ncbi:GNAT family N-acetyltransferase [Arthrobacter sp. KBS0702]|uniref:GNAT family N-acetyltransferase n=1 Tax=Arthrobacter sp. KBS0702 TaxID=2578107 RepID=UPI00110D6C06|nr:GNAT family N-acetyltransferase [Arthrobacter sp. KBS0702]QDW28780.1 GNAT family N-acetyltransferase [Arthrobacter sp. KBS0702]
MNSSPLPAIRAEQGSASARDAAQLWARATARRDHLPVIPSLEDKLPAIQSTLALDGAILLVMRISDRAMAFSIVVPHGDVLEVLYLAVAPEAWGTGLARQLLDYLRNHSVEAKTPLELWVIADNDRAIDLYERAGWISTSEIKIRNSAGRPERRYILSQ